MLGRPATRPPTSSSARGSYCRGDGALQAARRCALRRPSRRHRRGGCGSPTPTTGCGCFDRAAAPAGHHHERHGARVGDHRFLARSGLRVAERPVTIRYTDYSRAKGQSLLNGVNILFDISLNRNG